MPAQALDEIGPADDDPRLRPAEQLVAREGHEMGARLEALARGRLVTESARRPGAEVVDEDQTAPIRDRAKSRRAGRSVNPTMRKFDWCTRRIAAVNRRSPPRSRRAWCCSSCRPRRASRRNAPGRRGSGSRRRSRSARRARRRLRALRRAQRARGGRRRVVVDDERGVGAGQLA